MYRAAPMYQSRGVGGRMYDSTASFGRLSAGFGFWVGVLMCALSVGFGAYIAFTDKPLPSSKPAKPGAKPPSRQARRVTGGVMSAIGLLVLCVAWGQRALTRSSKVYASASGTSGLLSMF